MEPWPSFFLHVAHAHLRRLHLRLCTHGITSFALPKVHSDAEGGPLNLPQALVICRHVGYAEFIHPLRTTMHHSPIFSSASPPSYIVSIPWMFTLPSFRPLALGLKYTHSSWFLLNTPLSCSSPSWGVWIPAPLNPLVNLFRQSQNLFLCCGCLVTKPFQVTSNPCWQDVTCFSVV